MSAESDVTRPPPLYQQVARKLRAAIHEGRYQPGDQLPSESTLQTEHRVSRQTVRQAITVLDAEGLVTVLHGVGTFVRNPPIRLRVSRYGRAAREPGRGPWESACAAQGVHGHTEMVTVEVRLADDDVADALGVPVGTDVVYRLRWMHAGDPPGSVVQIQEGHLPLDLVAGTVVAGREKVADGIYAALDAIGHAPAVITEDVAARMPTATEAVTLGLRPGVPVLRVTRTTRDATGRVIEWLVITAAGDRNVFTYEDMPVP